MANECPRSDFLYETDSGETQPLSQAGDCETPRKYESVLSGVFLEERSHFLEALNTLYKNHAHHPHILSQKRTEILRTSRMCFEQICQKIVNICKGTSSTYETELQKANTCTEKINTFFDLHLLESHIALKQNAERKQRSVFREKFRQIEGKMRQYFVRLAEFLYNRLTDFDGKFTNFTAEPS